MERGDIYLVSLDPTSGHEQRGFRPVLVVTRRAFNVLTGAPVILPITRGGQFARVRGFAVNLDSAGLRTRGVVRCDQPRTLDLEARHARPTGERVSDELMAEILARLAALVA
jgi:mRNA-degrading endonuclease toxin of MazEF toxin-antitoxin module